MTVWTRREWLRTSLATMAASPLSKAMDAGDRKYAGTIGVLRAGFDPLQFPSADVLIATDRDWSNSSVEVGNLGDHTCLVQLRGRPSASRLRQLAMVLREDDRRVLAFADPDWSDCAQVVAMLEDHRASAIVYLGAGEYCRTPPLFGGTPDPAGAIHLGFSRHANVTSSDRGPVALWTWVSPSGRAHWALDARGVVVDEITMGSAPRRDVIERQRIRT